MITTSARMLIGRSRDQLVGNVGRARHRLDQRRRSPLRMEQVIGGQVAREQAFGGDRRRSIDGALPHPFRPRQERGAQHVEDADAEREHAPRARADRRRPRTPTAATRPARCAPAPDRRRGAAARTPRARRPLRSARRDPRPARARTSATARAPATSHDGPQIASIRNCYPDSALRPAMVQLHYRYAGPHHRLAHRTICSRPPASCWSA